MRAFTRRFGGAALVCAAGASLFAVGSATANTANTAKGHGCTAPKSAWHFVSAPGLRPAHVHVCTRKSGVAPGMVFVGPFKDALHPGKLVGQSGALMVDQGGNPVWFHPAPKGEQDSDIQTESYGSKNQPVISLWQGKIALPPKQPVGAPLRGAYYFYNSQYHVIKTLKAQGKGWITDFHELAITKPTKSHPQGTAVFFAAKKKSKNLRPYGGSANGSYEDAEIQQVDLATNKLIFHWDVDQHIKLKDSKVHAPKSGVWDPYHANSINLNKSGDILLSLRNTWGVYALSPAGKFLWQVGGKCVAKKCLSPTKSAMFFWQHDVRYDGNTKISMFDDGCCNLGVSGPEHAARGLVVSLNFSKKRAGLVRQFHHPHTSEVPTAGSFRFLSDGHAFIGWGQSYFYSEYTNAGKMVYDAAMPKTDMSYRAWKGSWTGMPTTKPSAAARKKGKKVTVYASWNGATTVASWKVLGSSKTSQTKSLGKHTRHGFETAVSLTGAANYYKVEALASDGKTVLGSTVIKG